ncbi:flavodoxin-dependent (E)-4-hydroxy-3-methylbut-2-enyl-diphosphate synthase [Rickettsiales bacterium LUAb2]
MFDYKTTRKLTREVTLGNLKVGGNNPITVQSMTNTITADFEATYKQIRQLEEAGVDIVRVSCPDKGSIESLTKLTKWASVPIVADIHFHYKRAIEAAIAGAACLRINPGNIGSKDLVKDIVTAAKDHNCSMRIGVNAGSLEANLLEKYKEPTAEALVESALSHAKVLEDQDFFNFKISVKASNVFLMIKAYTLLSEACDYPLHLGVTEAGPLTTGTVKSSLGIGHLLYNGIGDTIRVSLSANPVEEVKVGFEILKSLNLREKGVRIISCPSCARQGFDVVSKVTELEQKLSHIKQPITVSILGCVVNGIGEAAHSNIGIVGVNNKENLVYVNGVKDHTIDNDNLIQHIINLVEQEANKLDKQAKSIN